MKTNLSRTPVEKNTRWNVLGICYWCRFFITCFFVATNNMPIALNLTVKIGPAYPTPSCSLGLEIPFSSFPRAFVFVERDDTVVRVFMWLLSFWALESSSHMLSGVCRAVSGWPEGFGAGILIFEWDLNGSLWWVLLVTSACQPDCVVWVARPVLFSHADSHHPGLPCGHPAAEGRSGGLLHEYPEHCAAGPEVSPGPSLGCGYHTQLSMYCPRVVLS